MPNNNDYNYNRDRDPGSWIVPIIFCCIPPLTMVGIIWLIIKISRMAKTQSEQQRARNSAQNRQYEAQREANRQRHDAQQDAYQQQSEARQEQRSSGSSLADEIKTQVNNALKGVRVDLSGIAEEVKQVGEEIKTELSGAAAKTQKNTAQQGSRLTPTPTPTPRYPHQQAQARTPKGIRIKGNGGAVALFVIGLCLLVPAFILWVIYMATALTGSMWDYSALAVVAASFQIAATPLLIISAKLRRKNKRFRRYAAYIGGRDVFSIEAMARSMGLSQRKVRKDLEKMISSGWLPRTAYIDMHLNALVMDSSAAERYTPQQDAPPVPEPETEKQLDEEHSVDEYEKILLALRKLNEEIADERISHKISRIESVSAKIFDTVRKSPEKLPQIRRMLNYYLPTTLKLLGSYATFEKQGVGGENIDDAKTRINNVLDTLASGFERQLDKLYINEAIDIGADINVLENMMIRDGLSGSSIFDTSSGSATAMYDTLSELEKDYSGDQ